MRNLNTESYEEPPVVGYPGNAEWVGSEINAFDILPKWEHVEKYVKDFIRDGYLIDTERYILGILPKTSLDISLSKHDHLKTFFDCLANIDFSFGQYKNVPGDLTQERFIEGLMQMYFQINCGNEESRKEYASAHRALSAPTSLELDAEYYGTSNVHEFMEKNPGLYPHTFILGQQISRSNPFHKNAARLLIGVGALEECVKNGLEIKNGIVQR